MGKGALERMSALVDLRDLLEAPTGAERTTSKASRENRKALAEAYSAFVKSIGYVGESVNQSLLSGMPDGPLVTALK